MLRPYGRVLAAVVISVLLALPVPGMVAASTTDAHDTKPVFSAVAAPASAPAGARTTFSVTLTQLAADDRHDDDDGDHHHDDDASIGSARVSPPAGFTVISASAMRGMTVLPATVSGNSVTVNNLGLHHAGDTVVITIVAFASCGAPASGSWTVIGHQSDSFMSRYARKVTEDPASQLGETLSACSLAFVAGRGPAESQVNTNISSEAARPAGAPVQVQLVDGAGGASVEAGLAVTLGISAGSGTSGAQLLGTTTVQTDSAGVAGFGQLSIDRSGQTYTLDATGVPGTGSATSDPFDIHDVLVPCPVSCTAVDSLGNTTGKVVVPTSTDNNAVLGLSLGVETLDCNDAANHFYVSSSEVLTFDFSGPATPELITMTLAKASVTKPAARYQVCYSSPKTAFVNRFGVAIPAGGAGLLPDCADTDQDHGHHSHNKVRHHDEDDGAPPPCLQKRGKDSHGNVFVRFLTLEGDPRGKF